MKNRVNPALLASLEIFQESDLHPENIFRGPIWNRQHSFLCSPARAKNYSNLPYTYTCVRQLNPFHDDTLTYVAKLAQAGVDVEFHLYPGGYHRFEFITPDADISIRASCQIWFRKGRKG